MPDFSRCNHTELYQLCRRAGLKVSPSMSVEELALVMSGELDDGIRTNEIDSWRHGLTGFVFDHWQVLQPQLTCPIRSKDPNSCWTCTDIQVIACLSANQQYEHLIKLHRK